MSDWLRGVIEVSMGAAEAFIKYLILGLNAFVPIEAPVDDLIGYIEAVMPYMEVANRIVAIDWFLYYLAWLFAMRGFLYFWRLAVRLWELIPMN